MKNKVLFLLILLLYFILPIIILNNHMLFNCKFYILTIVGLFIFIMIKLCKISNKELGIKKENIFNSIKRNIPIIILFVVIVVIFRILNLNKFIPNESIMFYLFYIFISCPIQEFLYRGIFGYFETNLIKNKNITLVLSSLSYSFVHVIYKDIFTCLLTFIFGLVLYSLYRKDYNLAGVSLSHIILGILTIYLGIIN